MGKMTAWMLIGILSVGTGGLCAEEPAPKEKTFKEIASIQGRGAMNILTSPGELASAYRFERKDHPKAWPVTYVPRFFTNLTTRVASGVNDLAVLPFVVPFKEDTGPITRHFDLPDYVWQKE